MLQVVNVSLAFGGRSLFKNVNLKFTKGNCYGIIGANGAGKSTFLKILSKELEPNSGEVLIDKNERMSKLEQNQNKYDDCTLIDTVIIGHKRLKEIMVLQEELYSKADFTEEDGIILGDLQAEFSDLNGWEAESDAASLLNALGIDTDLHYELMGNIDPKIKVKVLLAQALFGNPEILLLDEPTNNLDAKSTKWLENFLLNYENTVIVVSHDRYFLNKVCTHICDVDYGKINLYLGNYDFWYESSQLILKQMKDQNKKAEQRAKELQEFIARFSANASKSKQATSRKKELEKLTIEDIKPSSRKYPFIDWKMEREIGNDVLFVKDLSKEGYFKNLSFTLNKGDKVVFLSKNSLALTKLFDILANEDSDYKGSYKWGVTTSLSYLPNDNRKYFEGIDLSLVDWLLQYSPVKDDPSFIRGFLGRMLFSGEEALKKASVISGGERVRCMLSRMMMTNSNILILDEPTNHLDLESITSLNKGMINFKGVMLFSTNDHEIMQTVANRIIDIDNGFDKYCIYDEYLDYMSK